MLTVLPYHQAATLYFRQQSAVWNFFSSQSFKDEQLKEFRSDLLKNTYKFTEDAEPELFAKVNVAKQKLNLGIPVFLYQAQNTNEMNASIIYINGEAHIVFSGKILDHLDNAELLAIISHELSHVLLFTQMDGDVEATDRIITAIGNHPGSTPAHFESARLFKLYTELFCDRGAYSVTSDYAPIISSLVKIATGLKTVNADSFIKQADEVFSIDANTRSTGLTHPENFIRARAIWLWHTKGVESAPIIKEMLEGYTNLDELDLFKQQQLSAITRQIVRSVLHPAWLRTPLTLSLAKQYFPDFNFESDKPDTALIASGIGNMPSNVTEYLAYVLYDFTTVDKELEDMPLAYCFALSDELKLDNSFSNAVKKERKLTDKKVGSLKKRLLAELGNVKVDSSNPNP